MKPNLLPSLFAMAMAVPLFPTPTVTTVAGNGTKGYSGDGGPATEAQVNNVYGLGRGPDGLLYFCDMDNGRIRRILKDGRIDTYAGSDKKGYGGDGGPATDAKLSMPYEVAWDKAGNLYFVEIGNNSVRLVDAKTKTISTLAGGGKAGFAGDGGPAKEAKFSAPHSLCFDGVGDLYICDIGNHRVRKIDMKALTIDTWVGTGEAKTAADGSPIKGSPVRGPRALAFAPDGKAYLALREGNALLRLDPKADLIMRVAGTGKNGFTGNGGPARDATLSGPKGVGIGPDGNIYLADTESHSIRYLDVKKGTLEVLVGDGVKGDGPDGNDPLHARLNRPHGIFVDTDGAVYVGDSENHRVRVYRR